MRPDPDQLAAAQQAMANLGVTVTDLQPQDTPLAPTFGEYLPIVIAGALFVLPGMVALLALSAIYVAFGDTTAVTALFARLAPVVVAIIAQARVRVGQRALHHPALVGLAGAYFAALALFCVPFPVVIAVAALAG